jgi:hypothetical protein
VHHIFISYDRKDRTYTRQLAEHLSQQGLEIWMDDRIDYGDRWWRTVVQAILDCAAFVVVMTPDAEQSLWVGREILLAQREKKPIYPLLLRGPALSLLIDLQYVDVTDGQMPPPSLIRRLKRRVTTAAKGQDRLVASRRGGRYHRAGCHCVARIRTENRLLFADPKTARDQGYTPCLYCTPPGP